MKFKNLYVLMALISYHLGFAQNYDHRYLSEIDPSYWQQHVVYNMDIDMDVETYRYDGKQELIYTNNSPDTIYKVFYHLYPNAFQAESEMNARLKSIIDPDRRMVINTGDSENPIYQSRISLLKKDEIGYLKIKKLSQNEQEINYKVEGTILEVDLEDPIFPGEKAKFNMKFEGQVPVQIRRSGRNNKESVALSMSQWYPKLAEYDDDGWHTDPYILREFYGVWGDFNVNITIDKNYTLGGTGYLLNPNEVGHGYEEKGEALKPKKGDKLTWRFHAPNVHDFTWAADPEYLHDKVQVPDGPMLHFIYKNNPAILDNWKKLQPIAVELIQYFSNTIGKYPYKQYSIIQGGDAGMEYGMCTLITGERSFSSLVRVTSHEIAHSWFQFLLANNELLYAWMDEGFASYFSSYAQKHVFDKKTNNPVSPSYRSYLRLALEGIEEPLSTHADHFNYNGAYSVYKKGATFLSQLKYIIGEENFNKTFKEYYKHWAFKHPEPNDFLRIAEKVSGIQLDWYLLDWINTTKLIDFKVKEVEDNIISIERVGQISMPQEVLVTYFDDSQQRFYIPLREMRGEKPIEAKVLKDWSWAYKNYSFEADKPVKKVVLDPDNLLADINPENNTFTLQEN